MSLAIEKLHNVRRRDDGAITARCPACAEAGHDHTSDHLIVFPDGRFGCVAFPGDTLHRKRIWALTGDRQRRPVARRPAVRPAVSQPASVLVKGVLGRLGRPISSLCV